ncbi:MAG TPA: hypothetical protein VJN89_18455 [Candidatus Acidoferrum sp.]|nr:hypothetical protein [Candidatus Acidoferrum sp.]
MGKAGKLLEKRDLRLGSLQRNVHAVSLAGASRRRQRDVLCDVMLSATKCDTWLTLDELAKLTHYPPASISAQLRHLRKQEFGGYEVEKRQRLSGRILHGEDFGTVWEYRLQRGVCKIGPGHEAQQNAQAASAGAA